MPNEKLEPRDHPLAEKLYEIIFEADTFWGKAFDLLLLLAIVISVVAVSLETVDDYGSRYQNELWSIEWTCTVLFTLEYAIRIACLKRPATYIFSFYGIVDLLSVLPAYLGVLLGRQTTSFAVIRAFRLLRVFRILELSWIESEAGSLRKAVWDARAKVVVFFVTVLIIVTIAGAAMYEIEHVPPPTDGSEVSEFAADFESIPQSIYWAIITMTTVGYGDVVPHTTPGKFVAAILVLMGYSLIIVPTGFVSAELTERRHAAAATKKCPHCPQAQHTLHATYCHQCGNTLIDTSRR